MTTICRWRPPTGQTRWRRCSPFAAYRFGEYFLHQGGAMMLESEAWVDEALAEFSPIEAHGLALEFVDHQITVHPLEYGFQLKVLSATARLVSYQVNEIREQRIWLCDLVNASDDKVKRALLRGLERGAQIMRRRFATCEFATCVRDEATPENIFSNGPIQLEMRRLAERLAAGSDPD